MPDPPAPARTQASVTSHSPSLVTTSATDEDKAERLEPRVRRRNRIIKSCLECRRRKLKCDKVQPCANCVKASRHCHFFAPSSDPVAQAKLAEVKEKMGILERSLEAEMAQKRRIEAPYSDDDDDEIHNLDPSRMAEDDAAFYEDEEANDDIVDLGIAMGKVRITERIGGLMRPKFSAEVNTFEPIGEDPAHHSPALPVAQRGPRKRRKQIKRGSRPGRRLDAPQSRVCCSLFKLHVRPRCRKNVHHALPPIKVAR